MTRRQYQLALMVGIIAAGVSYNNTHAQIPVLGGIVESRSYYNGYGAGNYGSATYDFSYSGGYGNGPYGTGSLNEHEFLSTNRYSHGDAIYDGYGSGGYGQEEPVHRHNPYGFGVPKYHRDW